jgi:hypothetical protein
MERMASPLIIKPLKLKNGNTVPLILRLNAPIPEGVELRETDNEKTALDTQEPTFIRNPALATYPDSPLAGSLLGSALEAFDLFARSKGFRLIYL